MKCPECRNCPPVVLSAQALTWLSPSLPLSLSLSLSLWLQRGKEAAARADLENPPARFAWLHSLLVNWLLAGREEGRALEPHLAALHTDTTGLPSYLYTDTENTTYIADHHFITTVFTNIHSL